MPIIDALLLCHVSWVLGIESGLKKIGSSQRYEVEKYESLILGQLLDLISQAKIILFEPRFKSYNPWDMAN
jgi:hypothetical protein